MESNLQLVLAIENRLMVFRGEVKEDRWRRILNDLDDFSIQAMKEIMGEEFIKNKY